MFDFRRKKAAVSLTMAAVLAIGSSFPAQAADPTPKRGKKAKAAASPSPTAKPTPEEEPTPEPTTTPAPAVANADKPTGTIPPAATPSNPATAAATPNTESEAPASLTKEQLDAAISLDTLTVPTPGELFAALNKQCKPNWTAQYRGPINTAYSDRAQAALNLGGLIADGYVAIEAMDGQQVKNLGRDILALSKNLGISKGIQDRGETIITFADNSNWNALKEELEAMQNDVKQEMDAIHDEDLITLLSLGAWIRGTYVVTDVVLKNFSQNTSCILRQPSLVGYLREKTDKLPVRMKGTALMKTVADGTDAMAKLVSPALGETSSKEEVQDLHDQAGALLKVIAQKAR